MSANLRPSLALLLLSLFAALGNLRSQRPDDSYSAILRDIRKVQLDSLALEEIDRRTRQIQPPSPDSIRTQIFPALIEHYEFENPREQAFLYTVMAVTAYQVTGDVALTKNYIDREIELMELDPVWFDLLMAYTRRTFILMDAKEEEEAIRTALKLEEKLKEATLDNWERSVILQQLCVFFHRARQDEKALAACQRAAAFREQVEMEPSGAIFETLALLYERKGQYSQANANRKRAILALEREGDQRGLRVSLRNTARASMRDNQLDSAYLYFNRTFNTYGDYPFFHGWYMDQVEYGKLLLRMNRLSESREVLDTLGSFLGQNQMSDENLLHYYALKRNLNAKSGNYAQFLEAANRYDSMIVADFDSASARSIKELQIAYESEQKASENKRLKLESRNFYQILIFLVVSLILALLVMVLVIQRKRRDKTIFEQRQRLLATEAEKAEQAKQNLEQHNKNMLQDIQQFTRRLLKQQKLNLQLMDLMNELLDKVEEKEARHRAQQLKGELEDQFSDLAFWEIMGRLKEFHPNLYSELIVRLGSDQRNLLLVAAMHFLKYDQGDIATVLDLEIGQIEALEKKLRNLFSLKENEPISHYLEKLA